MPSDYAVTYNQYQTSCIYMRVISYQACYHLEIPIFTSLGSYCDRPGKVDTY